MPDIPRPFKCLIKSLDSDHSVEACFNPKELTIEKQIPWNKHKTSKGNNPALEFTDAEPKELTVELLFDTYESRENVHTKYVKVLEKMTLIIDDKKKRPPMCIFLWGKSFPSFMGVIDNLSTKYSMFLADGTPVRATCTVKIKQADKLTLAAEQDANGKTTKKSPTPDDYSHKGKIATQEESRRADLYGDNHRAVLDASGSEDGTLPVGSAVPQQD